MPDGHDTAQICLNGHLVNEAVAGLPAGNRDFCERCGEKSISACPKCQNLIVGCKLFQGMPWVGHYKVPKYCAHCGAAFPWTEQSIQAAIELLVEETNASSDDAKRIGETINNLVRDTPQTPLAASRFMRIFKQLGGGSGKIVHDLIVDIASETAVKMIWPGDKRT